MAGSVISAMKATTERPHHDSWFSVLRTARNHLEYLTQNDWTLIVDKAKQVTFSKDHTLIPQGKQVRVIYLLLKGSARVETESKGRISEIGPGEICGEMSFLEQNVSAASVVANGPVEALAVEWSTLQELFELYPHLA